MMLLKPRDWIPIFNKWIIKFFSKMPLPLINAYDGGASVVIH